MTCSWAFDWWSMHLYCRIDNLRRNSCCWHTNSPSMFSRIYGQTEGSKTKAKFTIDRYQISLLFNRDIFKRHVKAIRALLDQSGSLLSSEIQVKVKSEEESNLLNKDVKYLLQKSLNITSNLVNRRGNMNHNLLCLRQQKLRMWSIPSLMQWKMLLK